MIIYHYRLLALDYLSEDIILLKFLPESHSPTLTYLSGQYIEVFLENNTLFPLSISRSPNIDLALDPEPSQLISFHLKAGKQHPLAEIFLAQVKKQGHLKFTGPKGHCIPKSAEAYYFIAGGTGFSPIEALLTDLLPLAKPCLLYWGITHTKDLYQEKLLNHWLKKYPNFSYIPVLLEAETTWTRKTGWVHELFFQEQTQNLLYHVSANRSYYVYASGPYPMIQALKQGFMVKNLDLHALLSDMLPPL